MIPFKLLFLTVASFLVSEIEGHGFMWEPPARNIMWRRGYTNPVNYNDNEVFCGGVGIQFGKNDGKCGVCGDNWADKVPRDHEAGGKFANGIIGRQYAVGSKIDVTIELSANHYGYFELKLCPVNNRKQIVKQECLDEHPLYLATDPSSYRYYVPKETKKKDILHYQVLLPPGVTCSQCVVQWKYTSGNTWGFCNNGTGAMGCGPQETFVNCGDVAIVSNTVSLPPKAVQNPTAIYFRDSSAPGGVRPLEVKHRVCIPTPLYAEIPDMDQWCQYNCLKYPPNCPKSKCNCIDECEAIGELKGRTGTDVYCHKECLKFPSNCPEDKCRCWNSENTKDLPETEQEGVISEARQ